MYAARNIALAVGGALLGLFLVAALLIGTNQGRGVLAGAIERLASSDDFRLTIEGAGGSLRQLAFARIAFGDREGDWLDMNGVTVNWAPSHLLRGRLVIDSLAFANVAVARLPASGDDATEDGMPRLPFGLAARNVRVERVALAPEVLGVAAILQLEGSFALAYPNRTVAGSIDLRRIDGASGRLLAEFAYIPETTALRAQVDAYEPEGGLIVHALGLEGLPEMRARLDGDGMLDDWRASLLVQAGESVLAEGDARIQREDRLHRLTVGLTGEIEALLPQPYRALGAGRTALDLDGSFDEDGNIDVSSLIVGNRDLRFVLEGAGNVSGFVKRAKFRGSLGRDDGRVLEIPLPVSTPVALERLDVNGELAPGDEARLTASMVASRFAHPEAGAEALTLSLSALLADRYLASFAGLDAMDLGGEVRGLEIPDNPGLAAALGRAPSISASGAIAADGTTHLESVRLSAAFGEAMATGTLDGDEFRGNVAMESADLAPMSLLAGRPLYGGLRLDSHGTVGLADGALDMSVEGLLRESSAGMDALESLLRGEILLSGRVVREADGTIILEDVALRGEPATARLTGTLGPQTAEFAGTVALSDVSVLNPTLSGAGEAAFTLRGALDAAEISGALTADNLLIAEHPINDARLTFEAVGPLSRLAGQLKLEAALDAEPLAAQAGFEMLEDGSIVLSDLDATFTGARAEGVVVIVPDGPMSGRMSLAARDLSTFSNLAGVGLAGSLTVDLTLKEEDGRLTVTARGEGSGIRADRAAARVVALDGTMYDVLNAPAFDGRLTAEGFTVGDFTLESITLRAEAAEGESRLEVATRLGEADVRAGGTVAIDQTLVSVGLASATLNVSGRRATLAEPATIRIDRETGEVAIPAMVFAADGGRVRISGSAGDQLALDITLESVAAELTNAFAPELEFSGLISGRVDVRGAMEAPEIAYALDWRNASLAATRDMSLPRFAISARGTFRASQVMVEGQVTGVPDLSLEVSGTAGASPDGALAMTVRGSVPLTLLNTMLADRGATARGRANVDLSIAGTMSAPRITGPLTISGASFTDPTAGIVLTELMVQARLAGDVVNITSMSATAPEQGTITASGTIGIAPNEGIPVDLRVAARRFKIADPVATGNIDADLTLTGTLMTAPVLGGTVSIGRLDVTVPEQLPRVITIVQVEHVNPPLAVQRQLAEETRSRRGGTAAVPVRLDLELDGGSQIFVRGRGIDAVLGGRLTLAGTLAEPRAVGAFEMRRGRLDFLGRRLNFTRGRMEFGGDLMPQLDFATVTNVDATTITVYVTGEAANPQFRFESTPSLPQDEVVSRLIFGRSVTELSPMQIAQLSAGLATLGGLGGAGPGLLDDMRRTLGIDVLDVTAGADGGAAVTAGRYLTEGIYLGVRQGTTGTSEAIVDIDLTDNIKARGEVGSDGRSRVGIGVEWNY